MVFHSCAAHREDHVIHLETTLCSGICRVQLQNTGSWSSFIVTHCDAYVTCPIASIHVQHTRFTKTPDKEFNCGFVVVSLVNQLDGILVGVYLPTGVKWQDALPIRKARCMRLDGPCSACAAL